MWKDAYSIHVYLTPRWYTFFLLLVKMQNTDNKEWPYTFLVPFEKQTRKNISEVDKNKGEKAFPLLFKTELGQNPCSKTRENISFLWQKSNLKEEIKLILY